MSENEHEDSRIIRAILRQLFWDAVRFVSIGAMILFILWLSIFRHTTP